VRLRQARQASFLAREGAALNQAGEKAELLRMVHEGGPCLFCADRKAADNSFWFWYLNENYNDPSTLARLARSHGFCSRHARQLLVRADPMTATFVMTYLMRVARGWLEPHTRRLLGSARPRLDRVLSAVAPCPACAREEAVFQARLISLLRQAREVDVRATVSSSPTICARDFFDAASRVLDEDLQLLGQLTRCSLNLAPDDPIARLESARGARDPGYRSVTQSATDSSHSQPATVGEHLLTLIEDGTCPVCAAANERVDRFLRWLTEQVRNDERLASEALPALCPRHAWAAAELSPTAAEHLGKAIHAHWCARVDGYFAGLAEIASHRNARRRRREVHLSGARDLPSEDGLRARLLQPYSCPACHHRATAVERTCRLVAAGLAIPIVRAAYENSPGLCLPHLRGFAALGVDKATHDLVADAAEARIGLLLWELEEAQRRVAWDARFETEGPEDSAWRRAIATYSGVPQEPASSRHHSGFDG